MVRGYFDPLYSDSEKKTKTNTKKFYYYLQDYLERKRKETPSEILNKMPTLILMDSSLSLLRPAKRSSDNVSENGYDNPNESFQLMDLAKWGVDWLLSHIEKVYKLEYVAVLDYASQCDLVVPFTRDIAEVRAKVYIPIISYYTDIFYDRK